MQFLNRSKRPSSSASSTKNLQASQSTSSIKPQQQNAVEIDEDFDDEVDMSPFAQAPSKRPSAISNKSRTSSFDTDFISPATSSQSKKRTQFSVDSIRSSPNTRALKSSSSKHTSSSSSIGVSAREAELERQLKSESKKRAVLEQKLAHEHQKENLLVARTVKLEKEADHRAHQLEKEQRRRARAEAELGEHNDESPRSEQFAIGADEELQNYNQRPRSSRSARSSYSNLRVEASSPKHLSKEVSRLPLSVTGGDASESEEEVNEYKERESSRRRKHRHHKDDSAQVDSARRNRPPDSPSLSSLMRNIDSDNEDPEKDPLGIHHHARVHEITTSAQPKLVEYTKLSKDGSAIEHHVTTETQYGTRHERTLHEMEAIMRANNEFPEAGKPLVSGFPADPKLDRKPHRVDTGDELLDNPLGDPLLPTDNVLDNPNLVDQTQSKYHKDPFIDEKQLEYYTKGLKSVLPTTSQKLSQARKGTDSPILDPSERELAAQESKERETQRIQAQRTSRKRSDSLTELEQYAVQLAIDSQADNQRLMPPRTPELITPRDAYLPPPSPASNANLRPVTPPDFPVGVNTEARNEALQQTNGGVKPMRDLFDVSPRLNALGPASRSKLHPSLRVAPSLLVDGKDATLPLSPSHASPFSPSNVASRTQQTTNSAFPNLSSTSDHHIRHGSNTTSSLPNGAIFGSVAHAGSNVAFDTHHTNMCALCADRESMYFCYDCNLSLCSGVKHRAKLSGNKDVVDFTMDGKDEELEQGCHEAIHQEFIGHHFVLVKEKARLEAQEKARAAKLKARDKDNKSLIRGEYQPDLLLVEPADALELAPPPPPSPPRFFAVEEYLAAEQKLEKDSTIDLLSLQGICAICQHAKGSVWCEECQLILCCNRKQVLLDATTNGGLDATVATTEDASNPDCDHALHIGAHANHMRVPYDPHLHKRTYKVQAYSDAFRAARNQGYTTGDPISPPPSLPPSNLPTPRLIPTQKSIQSHLNPNPPPGSYNYKTGSYGPTCDICSEQEAVLYCQQCAYYLCIKNGCDHDVHAFSNAVESGVNGKHLTSHHRISLSNNKQSLMITPLPSPRFTPPGSPSNRRHSLSDSYYSDSRSRSSSRSRSRSPSHRHHTSKAHVHQYSKNPWCSRCNKHRALVSCLACEMNFCTNDNGGADCDRKWHHSEDSFRKHKRAPIDPNQIDPNLPPRFGSRPGTPKTPRTPSLTNAQKEANKLASLHDAASKELESARRKEADADRMAAETAELERRQRERKLDESMDGDDDIDEFFKAQRERARESNKRDLAATPRTIKKNRLGDDGFDPDSVQPVPQCQECQENRADIYCFSCKKFYCAHALNYFDAAPSGATGGGSSDGRPSTPTHHNNCFFHVHNLPSNRNHKHTALAHHETEKERRRSAKYAEREREAVARKREAEQLQREAAEAKRALAAQRDAKLRALEERRLRKIEERQRRLSEKEHAMAAWKEQQKVESQLAARRAREEEDRDRMYWLDAARTKILAMDAERAAGEKQMADQEAAIRAKHKALIASRDQKLRDEESLRWEQQRDEIRRKRAIRAENLVKQREWLAKKEREDKLWRERVAAQTIKDAEEARKVGVVEAEKNAELEAKLSVNATHLASKVQNVLNKTVEVRTETGAKLQKLSEAVRLRRQDLVELERERRREKKLQQLKILEEGMQSAAAARREDRERAELDKLREMKEDHREKLMDLREKTEEEKRKADDAAYIREKVERAAIKATDRVAAIQQSIDAERAKIMAIREKRHQREMAARKKAGNRIKAMGRIMEERDDATNTWSSESGSIRSLPVKRVSNARLKSRSDSSRTGSSFTQSSASNLTSHRTVSSKSSNLSSRTPSNMSSGSRRSQSTKASSASNTSASNSFVSGSSYTGSSRTGSEGSITNSISTASTDLSYSTGTTGASDTISSWSEGSFSVDEDVRSSLPSNRSGYPESSLEFESSVDPDESQLSIDSYLDSHPASPVNHRRDRSTSRSRSRSSSASPSNRRRRSRNRRSSRSRSRSRSSSWSSESSSDVTADDLSETHSARARAAELKKAPRAKELARAFGEKKDGGKFSLDQLQDRDSRGKLQTTTSGSDEWNQPEGRSSTQSVISFPAQSDGEPLPRDPATKATRSKRRAEVQSTVDPQQVWAMRVGESERGSEVSEVSSYAPSAVSFHSNFTDASVITPRSDAVSQLSAFEQQLLVSSSRDHRHVNANEEAGILRNSSSDIRALDRAAKRAEHTFVHRDRDPHQLSAQLLDLLDHSPGLTQPLRQVFRMLIGKWLNESNRKQRDTEILEKAFRVLMTKVMTSSQEGNRASRAQQLSQVWNQLMQARSTSGQGSQFYDDYDGRSEFELGLRPGEHESSAATGSSFPDGSYSSRRDGMTNLLVRPNYSTSSPSAPDMRHQDDDSSSVVEGTRSVTGEIERDSHNANAIRTQTQLKALQAARVAQSVTAQRERLQRRAARALVDDPYSDYERSFESVTTDSQASDYVNNPFNGVDGHSDISSSSVAARTEFIAGAGGSLASFELGLDPKERAKEARRSKKMARDGDEPTSEVGSLRTDSQSDELVDRQQLYSDSESSSSSAGSSSSDEDEQQRRHPSSGSGGTRFSYRLPPASDQLYNQDKWYVDFHKRSAARDEERAIEAQDRYDDKRRQIIQQVRDRDQPTPFVAPSAAAHGQKLLPSPLHRISQVTQEGLDEFEPGSSALVSSSNANPTTRMAHTLESEVGALQAVAGMRAQANPATFLPHEIRQHELRFGIKHVEPTFQQQIRQQQHHQPTVRALTHPLHSPTRSSHPLPTHLTAHVGAYSSAPAAAAATSSAHLLNIDPKSRVGATLLKAQQSLALDYPPAKRGIDNPNRVSTLPAATHVQPELAYLQQLRRREIHESPNRK